MLLSSASTALPRVFKPGKRCVSPERRNFCMSCFIFKYSFLSCEPAKLWKYFSSNLLIEFVKNVKQTEITCLKLHIYFTLNSLTQGRLFKSEKICRKLSPKRCFHGTENNYLWLIFTFGSYNYAHLIRKHRGARCINCLHKIKFFFLLIHNINYRQRIQRKNAISCLL